MVVGSPNLNQNVRGIIGVVVVGARQDGQLLVLDAVGLRLRRRGLGEEFLVKPLREPLARGGSKAASE